MAALMIDSGSLTPGVDPRSFRLPPGAAVRYERPAEPLTDFFASYAALDSDIGEYRSEANWMLPGWARLCVHVTSLPVSVSIGRRTFRLTSPSVIYGVPSQAMPVAASGGLSVLADLTPLGWARFMPASAEGLRDQVVPLDRILPGWGDALTKRLADIDRGRRIKPILDAFLLERLPPAQPDEALVRGIMALLVDPGGRDLAAAAADLGVTYQTLLRVTKRHFGFGPKLLLRRARFLRAIAPMLADHRMPGGAEVPAGYHDAPHFLRDANLFLGMTPRRFLSMDLPLLRAGLRARRLVTGAITPSLDPPARVALGAAA